MKTAEQIYLLKIGSYAAYVLAAVASLAILLPLFGLPRAGGDSIGGIAFLSMMAGLAATCLVRAWTRVDDLEKRLLTLETQART